MNAPQVSSGTPSFSDVVARLGRVGEGVEHLNDLYEAEVLDQAARCRTEPYTEALAAALVRRITRAIAMRHIPLGVQSHEGAGAIRIGTNDPEVRRLEAPYRRAVIG